ncbi:MAG: hypothetical protein NC548_05630 [Lachnospiraceae bacterium]|nr:hypothetical protein [Lachnospiraceae bacterium]
MEYFDRREMHIMHPDVTLMCPKCYATTIIGKVNCDITVESILPIPQELSINAPALLTYPVFGKQMLDNMSMITANCPMCTTTMIALDTPIAPYIEALNRVGLYTTNSCAGHNILGQAIALPYISFAYKAPELVAHAVNVAMQDCLKTPILAKERGEVINNDESKFLIRGLDLEMIEAAVNVLLNPATPGIDEFKETNKQFHVESLYDLIIIEQE